jgi:hypothetical protein
MLSWLAINHFCILSAVTSTNNTPQQFNLPLPTYPHVCFTTGKLAATGTTEVAFPPTLDAPCNWSMVTNVVDAPVL